MKKFLILLIPSVISSVDSKAKLLNAKLVTARQEFPGFSFVDLYLRQSDLFRENCDIDPDLAYYDSAEETSYILSDNNEFQYIYSQKLVLTDLKYTTCPAGHIRENCTGICVLPNKLKLKGCWSEYPSIIYEKDFLN